VHRLGTKCPPTHAVLFTIGIFLFLTAAPAAFADSITYLRIEKPVLAKYVQDPPSRERRIHTLRERFERAGCAGENLFERKVPNEELPNLICVIPGTDRQTVLVGARMDYNSHGDEEKVDWATVSMLPVLAESVNGIAHRHTMVFIAVGGRKRLAGWTQYLKQLSGDQKKLLLAVIDLEQVGRTPAMFNGVRRLSRLLSISANALRQTPPHFFYYGWLTPEAELFYYANIPILMLTSPAFALASRGVEADAHMARTSLDLDAYYDTYNLMCVYLIRADELLGTPANAAPQTATTNIAPSSIEAATKP
jgi:hypothetical protein